MARRVLDETSYVLIMKRVVMPVNHARQECLSLGEETQTPGCFRTAHSNIYFKRLFAADEIMRQTSVFLFFFFKNTYN